MNGSLSIAMVNEIVGNDEGYLKPMMKRNLLKFLRETEDKELSFKSMDREMQIRHLDLCFNRAIVRYRAILR